MRIEAVTAATPEVQAALARLLPQLNPGLDVPSVERLQSIVEDRSVTLLLAKDRDDVIGTATVVVYTTPFWIKARIDEVVVDQAARGKGVGEALVRACLDIARARGAQIAELQSARTEARAVAHRLYRRMGFEVRNSDLFRISL